MFSDDEILNDIKRLNSGMKKKMLNHLDGKSNATIPKQMLQYV